MPDAESFDEFYRSSRHRVLTCLYAVGGDLAEAQDAAQEAYARAWERWGRVGGYDDPEAWVRRVGWRLLMSRFRRLRSWSAARGRLTPDPPAPPPGEDTVALVAALRRLPAEQRIALTLHHLLDLPVDEVARQTGAPTGTVKARLARGRAALSVLLRVEADAPGAPAEEVRHA